MNRDLLSADEVKRRLAISSATYYRWLRDGRLRGVKVGRRWRFERQAVEALLRPEEPAPQSGDIDEALRICRERLAGLGADLRLDPFDGAPASELAWLVIAHALSRGASDISIDPKASGVEIRERINGFMQTLRPNLPSATLRPILIALKERAGLDPSVEGRAQTDGHFFVDLGGRKVDLRFSTYPTTMGESLSVRALVPESGARRIEDLGFRRVVVEAVRGAISRPNGLVVVAGGAGSGKGATLYALVREVQSPERKVMTAEESVEVQLDGVLQAAVSPEFTLEDAMRAMYRNDLDVAMVSELRTPEAIDLALLLARTGHLVLAGLQATDTASALSALTAVDAALSEECVRGILAQRLLRRSCPACRRQERLTTEEADALGLAAADRRRRVTVGPGCDSCGGSGLAGRSGRTVAAEFLSPDGTLVEGSIRDDVLRLMWEGVVPPSEAVRALAAPATR